MRFDAIIIAVLYNHFNKMKQKGRNVIPWFQTVSVLSFAVIILLLLLVFISFSIMFNGKFDISISETYFLVSFMLSIVGVFFIIKKYYFDTKKYADFCDVFKSLAVKKQKQYTIIVLSILCLLPFILIYCLFLIRG